MAAFSAIFVAGLLVVLVGGALVMAAPPSESGPRRRMLTHLTRVRDVAIDELGRYVAALAVLLCLGAVAVVISWPVGRFARRFTPHIDAPFLRWTQRHVSKHGLWHHLNAIYTHVGNRPQIKVVDLAAIVVFGLLWARRGFWIPVLVVVFGFFFEKGGQMLLRSVVDRPAVHLPDFGTYPSGGCARAIVTYGLILELIFLTWPAISRRWHVVGWTVIAVVAFFEGYTRVYLIKHWLMDVVGGWIYGTLILVALVAGARTLVARSRQPAQ